MRTKTRLPRSVKIGPNTYNIVVRDLSGEGAVGRCNRDRDRIEIDSQLGSSAKVVTFWHEIIHAMLFSGGICENHDEIIVESLANQIVLFLQQNPGIEGVK